MARESGETQRERMLAGEPYAPGDPELVAARRRALALCQRFDTVGEEERDAILRDLLGEVGPGAAVLPPLRCDYGSQITLGPRSFVNFGLVALDAAAVTIGADVQIGPNVQLLTSTHPLRAAERRSGMEGAKPITLGDDVWLGGGVIVCPGVSIGARTVVGAGAVVVRDLPVGVLAAGNPARFVRELEPADAALRDRPS